MSPALEVAIEPYRREGFVVMYQSEGSITLSYQSGRFNYLLFVAFLLIFWPAAILYLISFNNRTGRLVTLRITSQGHIEESGYTLDSLTGSRRRERLAVVIMVSILAALILLALIFLMLPQPKML